jgi:hypothetical protein
MANDSETANAIAGLNGSNPGGRTIVVNDALPRAENRESKGATPAVWDMNIGANCYFRSISSWHLMQ